SGVSSNVGTSRKMPRLMLLPSALTTMVSVMVTEASALTSKATSNCRISSRASAGPAANSTRRARTNRIIELELDLRHGAVGFVLEFEIFGLFEPEHARHDVGGKG